MTVETKKPSSGSDILYFVKYPEPGRVKTRLARSVGAERAAELYRMLAEMNWNVLCQGRRAGWRLNVVYDPPEARLSVKKWLPGADAYWPQVSGE
jgi:glycosyltransferase A (GT-A) superfamily protein (DUF2064 family)